MGVEDERTPLQAKSPSKQKGSSDDEGPSSWACCRAVASIELPELEQHRAFVLQACLVLTGVGVFLCFVGFGGGYSASPFVMHHAPWIYGTVKGKFAFYGGVKYVCVDRADGKELCHSWSREKICDSALAGDACEACRIASDGIAFSVLISVITYLLFANKTHARWQGEDSAFVKFTASVMCLIGSLNFLIALWTYDNTCIRVAKEMDSVDITSGAGYRCIVLATILKGLLGMAHLALPVRPQSPKALASPEEEGKVC
jgi:hypothetical protein